MLAAFAKQGDINHTFARLAPEAPDVKQAEAKVEAANRDLAQAELDLRYCDVVAEIDGIVPRRNVNPGDNVQVGQGLMAVRSLTDDWVDANFKETVPFRIARWFNEVLRTRRLVVALTQLKHHVWRDTHATTHKSLQDRARAHEGDDEARGGDTRQRPREAIDRTGQDSRVANQRLRILFVHAYS
jgi:multidrug efflux pump subunit AcrA (membrane-fusion protein)